MILVVRTWAIWSRDRRVGLGLLGALVIIWAISSFCLNWYLSGVTGIFQSFLPLSRILTNFRSQIHGHHCAASNRMLDRRRKRRVIGLLYPAHGLRVR